MKYSSQMTKKMFDNDRLETYIFQGNDGEEVPASVQKLIFSQDNRILPDELCNKYECLQEVTLNHGLIKIGMSAFAYCKSLLELSIGDTVQHIGASAFRNCEQLTSLEFQSSTSSSSSPHQLATIEEEAFYYCYNLPKIKLPTSMTSVGQGAFRDCLFLVEANLSTTRVTEVSERTFSGCSSLQTVSLPNTLERIGSFAFCLCAELVTVVVPLDSKSIRIGTRSFVVCKRLANFVLPEDSTAEEESFKSCELLHERYGERSSGIVAGLMGRFDDLPVHRMCYDHSAITAQELRQCIEARQEEEDSLVDEFGMTPFHVLFSTSEPRMELLEVLIELLPNQILKWKDVNDRHPLDYLINNPTDGNTRLLQRTLQHWMIDPIARWGATSWMESMQNKVQDIVFEDRFIHRLRLCDEAYSALEYYENVEAISILEMAMWKEKLQSGGTGDITKRQTPDREECLCLSGSDVTIPLVATSLGISRPYV